MKMKSVLWVVLVVELGLFVNLSKGLHNTMCLGLGFGDEPFSIGVKGIRDQRNNTDGSLGPSWDAIWRSDTENISYTPDKYTAQIEVFVIKIKDVVLDGWLHLEIRLNDGHLQKYPDDEIRTLIINGQTDNEGQIGEFVNYFPAPKGFASSHELVSRKRILPCHGVSKSEPMVPWAYIYAPAGSESQKVFYLTWRFSQYYCNRASSITFRALVQTKRFEADVHKIYFASTPKIGLKTNYVFGAPDIIRHLNPKDISLTKLVDGDEESAQFEKIPWIKDMTHIYLDSLENFGCKSVDSNDPKLFVGRCKEITNSKPGSGQPLICNTDNQPIDGDYKGDYDEYINRVKDRDAEIMKQCKCRLDDTDVSTTTEPTIVIIHGEEYEDTEKRVGLPMSVDNIIRVWDTRIFHAICLTIVTTFVLPVNYFMARYFKETYMNQRINFFRIWYSVHIMSVPIGFIASIVGILSFYVRNSRKSLGYSLNNVAVWHRVIGYSIFGVLTLMCILGGLRPIDEFNRRACMFMHWLCGVSIYYGSLILIIYSVQIPASPSATYDVVYVPGFENSGMEEIVVAIIIWIVFEICMHIFMSVHQCGMDIIMDIDYRIYTPSPVPILNETDVDDTPGSQARSVGLCVFIIAASIHTLLLCHLLLNNDPEGRGFGPMTCTHFRNLTLRPSLHYSCMPPLFLQLHRLQVQEKY